MFTGMSTKSVTPRVARIRMRLDAANLAGALPHLDMPGGGTVVEKPLSTTSFLGTPRRN